ncbi:dienelactone hydrolase family protein [Aquitalea aquatica]|uniref:Dienelactone hydrolase family protein n=1 Tax=Aquitalea aquatica TaxID=3044273 RepID=A0A838Y005_9NEIS|nr:dienelactone hydrolase family protein [Aquitalea magnusonii]MBA4707986.1 dienelactone hydrolase family protein [Aquitalea magnusonii]
MNARWIDIPAADGQTFSAYLSLPPCGSGPGIVLVQEIWGVNEHIRAVADQYALAGYVVLAPDVFWRLKPRVELDYDAAGTQQAFGYYQTVDTALAAADVAATVAQLRQLPELTGKVATLGYCLGGQLAFRAAAQSQADAAVCFYGGGIDQHLALATQIKQPILFHYAGQDEHIAPSAVAQVKAAFAGKANAVFFDYPAAGHGFNCWGRQAVYNQTAAALAAGRTLQFLAEHL